MRASSDLNLSVDLETMSCKSWRARSAARRTASPSTARGAAALLVDPTSGLHPSLLPPSSRLPSLDARRVIARLEQLKAPSKTLENSFPPLSNGKVAPPVKEEAGWSQMAAVKPIPEPVVPEALPEEPVPVVEAPAPAPAPSPPEKRKKRPAKKKEVPPEPVAPEP